MAFDSALIRCARAIIINKMNYSQLSGISLLSEADSDPRKSPGRWLSENTHARIVLVNVTSLSRFLQPYRSIKVITIDFLVVH